MALSDLILWNRERSLPSPRREEDPLWSLQREMNRATFQHGVLTVTLPKAASARRNVRHIEVTTS